MFAEARWIDVLIRPDPEVAMPYTTDKDFEYYGKAIDRKRVKVLTKNEIWPFRYAPPGRRSLGG